VSPAWRTTLLHLVGSITIISIVFAVLRVRRISARDFLGLRRPPPRSLAVWVGLFVLLMTTEELMTRSLGVPEPERWNGRYSGGVLAVRLIAMILLAPFAEELVFRGVLFGRIRQTRLGTAGAILVPAVVFALLHVQYSALEMSFIALDGLFFGLARYQSGSLMVPILLHALGNAYAAYQRVLG
jgi:uncharacterized protein